MMLDFQLVSALNQKLVTPMADTIRLSLIHEDGQEWSAEMKNAPIILDELTWEWLKGAFVAIGYSTKQVAEFFDDGTNIDAGK